MEISTVRDLNFHDPAVAALVERRYGFSVQSPAFQKLLEEPIVTPGAIAESETMASKKSESKNGLRQF